MPKRVIIFTGPPTSGKGTQALELEQESGVFNLESTAVIREHFPGQPNDPVVIEQRARVLRGDIVDPPVILEWMREKILALAAQGQELVLSGSPRSLFETAGDERSEGLIPLFERLYGAQNIFIFYLVISEEEALKRSGTRRVCVAHDHPIPDTAENRNLTACPWDGSPLRRRPDGLDDKPDVIRKRYREYQQRMEPIFAYLRERGYAIHEIDGTEPITEIHQKVVDVTERRRTPIPAH